MNADKKVYLVLDNAKTHNNQVIQELWKENSDRLVLINTPAYSSQLNPQENIWNLLKNKIFTIGSKNNTDSHWWRDKRCTLVILRLKTLGS